jgi:hypothetical protein
VISLIVIPDSTTLPDRISSRRRRRRLRRNLLLEMAAAKGQQQRLKKILAVVATGLQIYVLKELVFKTDANDKDIKSGEVLFFFFFLAILRYGLWQADCLIVDSACFTMYDCKTPVEQWSRTTTIQQNKKCFRHLPSNFGLHVCGLLECNCSEDLS